VEEEPREACGPEHPSQRQQGLPSPQQQMHQAQGSQSRQSQGVGEPLDAQKAPILQGGVLRRGFRACPACEEVAGSPPCRSVEPASPCLSRRVSEGPVASGALTLAGDGKEKRAALMLA